MKKLFLLFVAFVATTCLWAQSFQVGELYYNITSSSEPYTVEVTFQEWFSSNNYAGLTTATIPETVTHNSTTNSVTSIGIWAFFGCSSLTSITIPNSVTSIGDYTFMDCTSLTSIIIPNSVKNIGEAAFSGCSSLTSITIPNSVTSIGEGAIYYCRSLRTVICEAVEVPELGSYVFSNTPITKATLYVSAQSLDDYKAAEQWKDFGRILPLEEAPSAVENTRLPIANGAKLLRNGQVYILQDGQTYTIQGQKL